MAMTARTRMIDTAKSGAKVSAGLLGHTYTLPALTIFARGNRNVA